MPIYSYNFQREDPIRQGDIFVRIPYLSLNYLFRLKNTNENSIDNDAIALIDEIIESDNDIPVETVLSSTVSILMSQDCDIENEKGLIFFPLVIDEQKRNYKEIKNALNNDTREVYLPELRPPELKPLGPLKLKLTEPFKVPHKLIWTKLKDLRIAKIDENIRKILVGKLTSFYSRLPIEEIPFLENNQIQNFLIDEWNQRDDLQMNELIYKVKYVLKNCNRDIDIPKIYFNKPIDKVMITEFKKKLVDLKSEELVQELPKLCEEILECKNLFEQEEKTKRLINELFIKENCLTHLCADLEIEADQSLTDIERIRRDSAINYFKNKKRTI